MIMPGPFRLLTLAGLMMLGVSAAQAEELTVNADHSQVVRLARNPATVVVGNPSIADVTIQNNMLFVHGRVFGKTNVTVLDDAGALIAEYDINVERKDEYNVVVFKPMNGNMLIHSFSCKNDCEAVLHVGDDIDHFKSVAEEQGNKLGIAQGQKPGQSSASNNNNTNGAPDQSQ